MAREASDASFPPPGLSLSGYDSRYRPAVTDLHIRSFTALGRKSHSEAQIAAHRALIEAPDYATDLARSHLAMLWAGSDLIATAGWLAQPDAADTARIRKVFVAPERARQGLASAMVRHVEAQARAARRCYFVVRANLNAVPLYERLGYRAVEGGMMPTPSGVDLPVVFMRKP